MSWKLYVTWLFYIPLSPTLSEKLIIIHASAWIFFLTFILTYRLIGSCKNNRALCTIHSVSPVVTSHITVIQWGSQEIDIGTLLLTRLQTVSRLHLHFCVSVCSSVQFYPIHSFCNHHHIQDTELYHPHRTP